jgi:hypothetical protein
MMMKVLLPALLALTLAGCASPGPTLYAPARDDGYGYSERRIEQDRYQVRFEAGPDMSIADAEDLALRRAAQLTLEEGGDWFAVVQRSREGNDRNPVSVGTSVSYSTGSRGFSSRGLGLGIRYDASAGQKTAMLEILIRSGTRPDDANAYDARSVLDNPR